MVLSAELGCHLMKVNRAFTASSLEFVRILERNKDAMRMGMHPSSTLSFQKIEHNFFVKRDLIALLTFKKEPGANGIGRGGQIGI